MLGHHAYRQLHFNEMVSFIFVKQIKFMFYGIHGARCAINQMFQYSIEILGSLSAIW